MDMKLSSYLTFSKCQFSSLVGKCKLGLEEKSVKSLDSCLIHLLKLYPTALQET